MKRNTVRYFGWLCTLAAIMSAAFSSCSPNNLETAGGATTETTNGVMAAIYKSDGSPAMGATVRLRRSDYVTQPPMFLAKSAIYGADALTDAQGHFEIMGIAPGSYSIEISDSSAGAKQSGAVLLACSLAVHGTINLGADTLRAYAAVRGSIDTAGTSGKILFVQMLGLERLVAIGPAGEFMVNDLPAGIFSLQIIAVHGAQASVAGTDRVLAISGDTVQTLPGWSFAKKLFLNTTASGANVGGNVVNFPVLVRLTSGNFSFSQAKSGGEDLRFTKADGTPLPYEIERWDATNSAAEIWVNVDTVYGNDSTHFITMYWETRMPPRSRTPRPCSIP